MLRFLITFLACLFFFLFGGIAEFLLNHVPHDTRPLSWMSQILVKSYPLNSGHFIFGVSPVFCAAMVILFLSTIPGKPLLDSKYFAEGALVILLLFGLYFGLFLLSLLAMLGILTGIVDGESTSLNITMNILDGALWFAAFLLAIRFFVKPLPKKNSQD